MSVKDRLEMYRNALGIKSQEEFAKLAGVPIDTYKRMKNPKFDTLLCFLNAFPMLSAEWLIRGNGLMLKTEPEELTNTAISDGDNHTGDSIVNSHVEKKNENNAILLEKALEEMAAQRKAFEIIFENLFKK